MVLDLVEDGAVGKVEVEGGGSAGFLELFEVDLLLGDWDGLVLRWGAVVGFCRGIAVGGGGGG